MIEPADHVRVERKNRNVGIFQVTHLSGCFSDRTMQPGADQKLLLPARTRSSVMLTADVTLNRAGVHEVVPTAESEAGDIHLVKVTCRVLLFPVLVVSGVFEYRMDQVRGVFGISGFLERHQPSRAPSAVAEVKQAL